MSSTISLLESNARFSLRLRPGTAAELGTVAISRFAVAVTLGEWEEFCSVGNCGVEFANPI